MLDDRLLEQDRQMIKNYLQSAVIPDEILADAERLVAGLRRCGHRGPIGAVTIAMWFFLKDLPPVPNPAPTEPEPMHVVPASEWDGLDYDGTVLVEVNFRGDWRPGTYWGRTSDGHLRVRMDDDPETPIPVNRHNCRLASGDELFAERNATSKTKKPAASAPKFTLDDNEMLHDDAREIIDEPDEAPQPPPEVVDDRDKPYDWAKNAKYDDTIYIDDPREGGRSREAKFVAIADRDADGLLLRVECEGEPINLHESYCHHSPCLQNDGPPTQ